MIELKHIRKQYTEAIPLKDVSTVINKGDVISVIGPSGTGKSTLLRCINMLDPPTSGEIYVDGECITSKSCNLNLVRRKLGMVFQSFNLFGNMTVIENLMQPQMDLLGRGRQEAYDKGMMLLQRVGMAARAMYYPDQLSGGQKQRVAIARTLAMDPEIILFDEPTSALDPTMVGEVQTVIQDLAKSGITMMIVTHEMKFAKQICNRVFYMDQGEIYEDGTPEEIFLNPKKERTRQFIKHLKVLEERITSKDFDFIGINTRIEEFGRKHMMSQKTIREAQIVFEELCVQNLMKMSAEKPDFRIILEYSEEKDHAQMMIYHNLEDCNPLQKVDELSMLLINNVVFKIETSNLSDGDYAHCIEVKLKAN